jgi:tRNA-dihydrouridine synthase B
MNLGALHIENPRWLAPMSGITEYAFRQVAREAGSGLTFTGLVSAEGLMRKKNLLTLFPEEHPLAVQLFGSEPENMAEASALVESLGADVVDINMGCPARQVVQAGAGANLMRDPGKVEKIVRAVRRMVHIPVTVKIRSGWNRQSVNALEIAAIADACGADAVCVHPRTMDQGFRGAADWQLISQVKRSVRIPVIGNGDVRTRSDVAKMVDETGCDAVMIGRGALGNPWIFSPDRTDLAPPLGDRRAVIERHLLLLKSSYDPRRSVVEARKHLLWYTRALPSCASFHSRISTLTEMESMIETVASYLDFVQGRIACR